MTRGALITFLLLILCAPLHAFTVVPMVAEIDLTSQQPRMRYTISNDGAAPIAVQIGLMRREIDLDGEESLSPTSELVAYPSQLIIAAGERRTVMVEWQGGSVSVEQPFRVIAEQVPVSFRDDPANRARIRMNLRYVASLYVRPPQSEAEPGVSAATVVFQDAEAGGSEEPFAELLLENRGTSRLDLSDLTYAVSLDDGATLERVVVASQESSAPTGVVLPGGSRRILLPLPEPYALVGPGTPLSVSVER
ncbi:MAG: molecular chaperone [Alkalispirochaetaceae bacterium]